MLQILCSLIYYRIYGKHIIIKHTRPFENSKDILYLRDEIRLVVKSNYYWARSKDIHELGHNEDANVALMNSLWQGDNDRRPRRRPSHHRELELGRHIIDSQTDSQFTLLLIDHLRDVH